MSETNVNPLDVALWYATKLGWRILPLHTPNADGHCSCNAGEHCRSAGKHGRTDHGVHDASNDPQQIMDWWHRWPDANVGLACGAESGVIIIDIDPRNGGKKSLKALEEKPSKRAYQRTGGGGYHYVADYTDEPVARKPADGIDIQSDGRIAVLYPSLHASGKRYKWVKPPKPGTLFGPLPSWALLGSDSGAQARGRLPRRAEVVRAGERNEILFRHACRLRAMGSTEPEIYAWCSVRNRMWFDPPLDDKEVRQLSRSAMRYEVREKRQYDFEQTSTGNANLMIHLHGDMVVFSPSQGWLVWQDTHWAPEEQSRITPYYLAEGVGRYYKQMADNESDDKVAKEIMSWVKVCHSQNGITDIVKRSEQQPELRKFARELDSDPWLYNVQNGTVDLRTGDLLPHRKEDFITKLAPVKYDENAKAPRFQQFMLETFQGDQELIDYIQRLLGYCLTGVTNEQIFPVFWGVGGNGKSKLLEDALGAVMGKDYRVALSADTLMDNRFTSSKRDAELMNLRGARLAVASESKRRSLDEEMIKKLTGEDTITAKRLYRNPEEFRPTHKLILITNNKPRASNSDAIWRRLRLVPFSYKVPQEKIDHNLGDKLQAESSGILNWLIEGCLAWQMFGLQSPPAVVLATEGHREDQDLFGRYLHEAVTFGPKYKCKLDSLYQSYLFWCNDQGVKSMGKINFTRQLLERHPEVTRYVSSGYTRLRGVQANFSVEHEK